MKTSHASDAIRVWATRLVELFLRNFPGPDVWSERQYITFVR